MLLGDEIQQQLTQLLQREYVHERGALELKILRPWVPVAIPDESYTLKIVNLPTAGVTPHFIVQFEVRTAHETIGRWQAPLQARVWREILVARNPLKCREPFNPEDVIRERRDVLTLYDAPLAMPEVPRDFELAEMVPAGSPVYERSLRLRPVVRRGQLVEAQLRDGLVTISIKVEVLESGAPGQYVRVRNTQSKREFRGKVEDEQTVLVTL